MEEDQITEKLLSLLERFVVAQEDKTKCYLSISNSLKTVAEIYQAAHTAKM